MTAALVLEGVCSGYGATNVVRNVSMDVAEGEIVALLGRNGAGKTTLLSTIAGFVGATGGAVTVRGEPLRAGSPATAVRRGVGYVPEDRCLFTQLSVRDNLAIAGARRKAALQATMGHFPELERLLDRRAGLLSGGEQQMLAIARALIRRPRILLVDELSMGLAPTVCRRLVEILHSVARADGVSVLLVEQHIHIALEAADRAYVMRRGEITTTGTASELAADLERVRAAYLPTQGAPT